MTTQSNLSVANEILNQLGGRKFMAMTGSKNLVGGRNFLQMHLTTNKAKAKYLKIELTPMDTYTMTFSSLDKNFNLIIKAEYENVYCDQLQTIFTEVTGLYTKLY